mgnify:CR=1 FL=1
MERKNRRMNVLFKKYNVYKVLYECSTDGGTEIGETSKFGNKSHLPLSVDMKRRLLGKKL